MAWSKKVHTFVRVLISLREMNIPHGEREEYFPVRREVSNFTELFKQCADRFIEMNALHRVGK
jgi:hypothetical protein